MGKGGTKFVGEAIAHRAGRFKTNYTNKELTKMMEKYAETGVHPEIDRVERLQTGDIKLTPLPDPDPHRPYVFFDITIGNKNAGRIVIELFEDMVPAVAAHLRHRCLPGSSSSLSGTTFHKLLQGYGIFGGRSSRGTGDKLSLPINNHLRHIESGVVSVSLDGEEIAFSLGRALHMDATHQVVGRIHSGTELLEQMGTISTLPDDSPVDPVRIAKAGITTVKGTHEEAGDEGGKKLTAEEAAAKLAEESTLARSAVMMAVEEGLGHKRKADPNGASSSATAPVAGAGSAAAASASAKRSKMMDSMLGDLSESGSSGDSSQSDKDDDAG